MCLIYRPKQRPTFTRLCYRYRDMRGRHVPGEWACGEYPKPGRRPAGNEPGQTRPAALCERCRRPAPRPPALRGLQHRRPDRGAAGGHDAGLG